MTPQEKAERLIYAYSTAVLIDSYEAKLCALIAVDEILNLMINSFKWDENHNGNVEYWQEVKEEIEKL